MFGFLMNLTASHIFVITLIVLVIAAIIYLDKTFEKFGTTPAAFIQMNARDNQDDKTISGIRIGSDCGIRPTQRGSPKTGYLRFK
ncbi:uncharacterized protein METZ01_LOCUS104260 [marine metagenome]|jgi:hypothetical protein|uniref:Uncharacterized protein n=1 Tax=marine metagenome TaxID=408172 RepID=A0A381WFW2_9ZZZZ|tara:strand:+ start:1085 stop:1339 length:255 start_codon:yes stop_codon:yes gene_type:complete